MTTAQEALAVLDRTLSWITKNEVNLAAARYTEATLGRWLTATEQADASLADAVAEVRSVLTGFDTDPVEGRAERAARLRTTVEALRSRVGEPEALEVAPRARLLPEGVENERPLPPVPPPIVTVTEAPPPREGEAEPAETGASERPRGRDERAGGDRARDDRPRDERGREDRGREGRRRDDRGRDDRGRDGRAGEGRAAEGGRRRAEEPGEEDARAEAERRESERRDQERREAERRPPPPPEPRTFPLGHPEGTGVPVASLDVFTPAELDALGAAGVADVAALLLRPPVSVDRAGERFLPDALVPGPVLVRGTVSGRVTRLLPVGRVYEFRLVTDRATVVCRWPGESPAEVTGLAVGAEIGLAGVVELDESGPVLTGGEILGVDGRGGDWLPRYDVPGVPDPRMRAGVRAALRVHVDALQDHLPPEVLDRFKLLPLSAAVRDVHFPSNVTRKGRARLVFDELLQVQLGAALLKRGPGRDRGVQNPINHTLLARAMAIESWQFTDAQEAAFDDIRRDLRRTQAMARLVQGEPGSGTDLVILASMLVVAADQHQALYLAPDALTAEHRFLFSEQIFKAAGIEPVLLNGSNSRAVLENLKKGDTLVAFGTHALLREMPAFRKLGLVVVEEFGGSYGANAALEELPTRPDLLVVTPTPVATTIALTVYGHLAVTALGPGPGAGASAKVIGAGEREVAYAAAREALEKRQQVLLVFPLVKNQDLLSPSEARRLAEVLAQDHFPGVRVGIFNGAMSREERFRAYDDFAHRRTDLLLATSFVEHGPPVPDASVMLVEHAQMLDLTRLHRLRGHVAGGFRPGRCFLIVSDEVTAEERARLDLLVSENDGYQIAEHDLAARGLAAFLGEDADTVPVFRWADPVHDRETLLRTRAEAVRLLQFDPGLRRRSHRALLTLVRARVGEEVGGDAAGGGGENAPSSERPAQGGGAGRGGGGGAGGAGARKRRRRR